MNIQTNAIDLHPLVNTSSDGSPLWSTQAALPFLGQLKVRLTAQLGGVDMTVAELIALKQGEVVALDKLVDEPIDLLVEGHKFAQGTLVAVGEHFGVRITAVPELP